MCPSVWQSNKALLFCFIPNSDSKTQQTFSNNSGDHKGTALEAVLGQGFLEARLPGTLAGKGQVPGQTLVRHPSSWNTEAGLASGRGTVQQLPGPFCLTDSCLLLLPGPSWTSYSEKSFSMILGKEKRWHPTSLHCCRNLGKALGVHPRLLLSGERSAPVWGFFCFRNPECKVQLGLRSCAKWDTEAATLSFRCLLFLA